MKKYNNINNCLYYGRVFHARKSPKNHMFKYKVLYLHIDITNIKSAFKNIPFLSLDKFNFFSFYTKDHGSKDCKNLDVWIRKLLKKNGIQRKIKNVFLLTYPRILGYVFNPLSIYTCVDDNNNIIVQIYEVNNTFKQRFFYIVKNTFDIKNHEKIIKKKFHVSPFISMDGTYNFKSFLKEKRLSIFIKYKSKKEYFIASFTGVKKALNGKNLIIYFLKIPFMTLKIIVGIHFEAIILYLKGLKYFSCPKVKEPNYLKYSEKD
ncbi:MAG: DUF1365 domain-containing protein [Rickettsiales bacterium]|nr:DUF1365 domain-containing protein [Rickettsiales bacterium]